MTKYYLVAGEPSGDLHGKNLIIALQSPEASFLGVGGPLMRETAFSCLFRMESFKVMGFTDVLKSLPSLVWKFYQVKSSIFREKPECLILIDYPGFNLRLARALRKEGFKGKIIQMISPSVWAHGKDRIRLMEDTIDLLITIYPFESKFFSQTRLKTVFIGNPLVNLVKNHTPSRAWKTHLGIVQNNPIIALFPGSRKSEVSRHLPLFLQACELFHAQEPRVSFCLSVSDPALIPLFEKQCANSKLKLNRELFLVPKSFTYDLMRDASLAVAKSGTVTLELALHKVPTVVTYCLSKFNYLIGKYYLKLSLPFYCIVNILADKMIYPELIEVQPNPERLFKEMWELFICPTKGRFIQAECQKIETHLYEEDSAKLAASFIHLSLAEKL